MDFNHPLLLPLAVFALRIINNAISTIRVVYIARQEMVLTTIFALLESLIFAFTVANVVNDLSNPLMLSAYSGGFAVGSLVGLWLERRLVQTFLTVNVILQEGGRELAYTLREAGFGVTETRGEGKSGGVSILRITVDRRDMRHVTDIVGAHSPNAFVSVEEARAISQGYFKRFSPGQRR